MHAGSLETLFVGRTARPLSAPVRVDGLIAFRRFCGEGVDDASGPPGSLLRAVWGYFRSGGARAIVAALAPEEAKPSTPPSRAALAAALAAGLGSGPPPLVVLPGIANDPDELLSLTTLPGPWPDPSPLVLLDAPRLLARDPAGLAGLSRDLLAAGGGRFRLVAPPALGAAPVQGPSRPGPVSPAALAAGLVMAGGTARIAGAGLSFVSPPADGEVEELRAAGVILLRPLGGGWLGGLGLPRLPGTTPTARAQRREVARSPFGDLVTHLTDALAHHAGTSWDTGLCHRVERDTLSALARFFGRETRGYRARCDEELNPPEERGQGRVVVEVILAPPLPVVQEVVLRLTLRQ